MIRPTITWRPSDDDSEMTLLVDGKRRGALIPWQESATGTPCGYTAVEATSGDDCHVKDTNFWTPEDDAKRMLLAHFGLTEGAQAAPMTDAIEPAEIVISNVDALDAARYRWLRDKGHIKCLTYGAEVDRLVDAEMAKPPVECPF